MKLTKLFEEILNEDNLKQELSNGINIGNEFSIKYINPPSLDGGIGLYKDNKQVGFMEFESSNIPDLKNKFIRVSGGNNIGVKIDNNLKGIGIGSKFYKVVNSIIHKIYGFRLQSESEISQSLDAYKLWKRFYENGDAEIIYNEGQSPELINGSPYYEWTNKIRFGDDIGVIYGSDSQKGMIYTGNIYALK